jgi:hypothetical protein
VQVGEDDGAIDGNSQWLDAAKPRVRPSCEEGRVTPMQRAWAILACLALVESGCGQDKPSMNFAAPDATITGLSPTSLGFIFPNADGYFDIKGSLLPADVLISSQSRNGNVFTTAAPTVEPGGLALTVHATGVGIDRLDLFLDTNTSVTPDASASIRVFPGGTWAGSVGLTSTSCSPPGQAAYNETLMVSVNSNGTGTMTAIDTPGFNRQYAVTFQDEWLRGTATATSTGAFSYNGLSVTGAVSLKLTSPATIDYTETTTYPCSATYHGVLTRAAG